MLMKEQEQRIKIAIQKSGRLSENSLGLLLSCGLDFEIRGRELTAPISNFPLDIYLLKDDDILTYVEAGAADLGIVGGNLVQEYKPNVNVLSYLGFARCKLTVGVPKESAIVELSHLSGSCIATSLPNITSRIFLELGIVIETKKLNGSVEIAPFAFPYVTAISDITETGDTMTENGLRQLQILQEFEAVLIGNPTSCDQKGSRKIIDQLLFRMSKVVNIGESYE